LTWNLGDNIGNKNVADSPTTATSQESYLDKLGTYGVSKVLSGIYVENDKAYLANNGDGLMIVDIKDPYNPVFAGQYKAADIINVVAVGNKAYAVQKGIEVDNRYLKDRLLILDVENPNDPKLLNQIETEDYSYNYLNIAAVGDYICTAGWSFADLFDVSDSNNAKKLWTWNSPSHSGNPCNIYLESDAFFITAGWAGLYGFDTTNMTNPNHIGSCDTSDWAIDIDVENNLAFLTLGDGGLFIVDITDPKHPKMIEKYKTPGFALNVTVLNHVAYVSYLVREKINENVFKTVSSGIVAYDVRNPGSMVELLNYDKLDNISDMFASGDKLYVADENRGLIIFKPNIKLK